MKKLETAGAQLKENAEFKNLETGLVGYADAVLEACDDSSDAVECLHNFNPETNDAEVWELLERGGWELNDVNALQEWCENWESLDDEQLEILEWLVGLHSGDYSTMLRIDEVALYHGSPSAYAREHVEEYGFEPLPEWARYNIDWNGVFEDLEQQDQVERLESGTIITNAAEFY